MAFTVVFQRRADADVRNQVAWLESTQGLHAADRWRAGFLATVIGSLEADPHRYPQADEAADLGVDLRELLYGRRRRVFRVLFTIDGETVNVLRVRHATQDRLQPDDV
jgi:plasmid stabilization system protein ParE